MMEAVGLVLRVWGVRLGIVARSICIVGMMRRIVGRGVRVSLGVVLLREGAE
jgi:hypothetical protein